MDTRKPTVTLLTFLLAFFIIASDMCMKSEARGPIVHLHCSSDADCQYRPCADKCGCICIDSLCQCSKPSFLDNVHTHPPTN
ncbi:hypothetical protein PHAVU_005G017400 [Phaseolus vulgaris]|uniref:Uncharacterized protein n=1 Tax=Phaseolus vulgaris TaxID=3885 RepID=V7BS41_PHAVU|nr:hypothetical protein PHAVU_005G017400g [Phaseolus vulgaris]ESW20822.1 hypothetical protein PHAVU_005G017400g [Phaseolus vulgaris]